MKKLVVLMMLLSVCSIGMANLVVNGGLNVDLADPAVGNIPSGSFLGWTMSDPLGLGEEGVHWRSGDFSRTGVSGPAEGAMYLAIRDYKRLTSDSFAVTAGTDYITQLYLASQEARGAKVYMRFNDASTTTYTLFDGQITSAWDGLWQQVDSVNTAPVGATSAYLFIDASLDQWSVWWALDGVSVTAVPEPATMILLGLGCLILKRKKLA